MMSGSEMATRFGASGSVSNLLVLFIPSHDRGALPIDQSRWVDEALGVLGRLFGGGTAYPRGRGVWRDDDRGGILHFDDPVVIQCYTSEALIEAYAGELGAFLRRMGRETSQGAIGFVIDREYLEIRFPLG